MKSEKGLALYQMAIFGVVFVLIIGVSIYTLLQSNVFIHPEDSRDVVNNTAETSQLDK